jgi:hypothetical protein
MVLVSRTTKAREFIQYSFENETIPVFSKQIHMVTPEESGESPVPRRVAQFFTANKGRVVQTIQCRRAVMAPHADRRDSVGESPDSMRHYWAMSEALIQRGGSAPSWPAQGGIVGERPCTRAFGLIALTPRHKKRTQCVCNPSTSRYESLR